MDKLILIYICLCITHMTFAQTQNMDVEGAINIANSESPNPVEGTIRWTGQDFEGFDGLVWKSLTCCDSDPESTAAQLNCPVQQFVLTDCNLLVNWTHQNPVSTTVNYEIRINGLAYGQSIDYPSTSNTANICEAIGINSGTGTFQLELLYWYDEISSSAILSNSCTVAYNFGDNSNHGLGKTFAQIEADAHDNFCPLDGDESYVAEYLYQHPTVCYWEVQTINNVKCVVPIDVPSPPSDAIQLPPPSGGNDTQALQAKIDANPGGNFVGTAMGNIKYRLDGLDIKSAVRIWNVPAVPVSSTATRNIWNINVSDVRLYYCPIDGQNSTGFQFGYSVADGAHRFHLIRSGVQRVKVAAGQPINMTSIRLRQVNDFHIAGNTFTDLFNYSIIPNTTEAYKASAIWHSKYPNAATNSTSGGYIVNNTATNFPTPSSQFYTKQSFGTTGEPVKIYANRCIDCGARFVKFQSDDGLVLSNDAVWTTKIGLPEFGGKRRLQSFADVISGADHVNVRNNRFRLDPAVGSKIDQLIGFGESTNLTGVCTDVHVDCNLITINSTVVGDIPQNPSIFFLHSGTPTPFTPEYAAYSNGYNRYSQCSIKDNVVKRDNNTGSIEYHWNFSFSKLPDTGWPAANIDISGNDITVPWTVSEFK